MNLKQSFPKAVNLILAYEGGYTNIISDLGGETNFGISKKAYPNLDIKKLTVKDATDIYKRDYWDKLNCDSLPEKLDIVVFDCGVNQGTGRATELLKKSNNDWRDFLLLRIQHYNTIVAKNPSQIKFLKGWINRVIDLWTVVK